MVSLESEHNFLEGGGEMGKLIRARDWNKTPLGDPNTWPQSLRIAVRIMLDTPFGMYIAWGKEYIQLYNDGYRPILGATKHPQALGISTRETFTEIWTTIGPMFDGVMEGTPVGFPDFILHLDRNGFVEECVFDFSYSPIRLEDGKVGGVLVTVIETTEKVKAVKALKESEQQLLYAIEASELGTWDLNPVTNKFRGNSRLKEWFGLHPDEEIELPLALAVIAEKDRYRVISAIENAMQFPSGGHYDIIYTIIHPQTNNERIVRAKGLASFNDAGIAYRFNGTLQDVTKEKVAHQLLTESEQLLSKERMVLYNSFMDAPAAIAILKGDTHIYEFSNAEYEKLVDRKITIGKTVQELFPELEQQGLIAIINTVFKTGEAFSANELPVEIMNKKTGKLVLGYYNVVLQPLKDEKGNTERLLSHSVEVTKQIEARKQIEVSETSMRQMASYLKLATDSANVGTWSLDVKSGKLEWSALHKTIWGYDENREDIVYEDWHKVIDAGDKEKVFKIIEEAKVNHTLYDVDYCIHRANDGALRCIRSVGKYYYNHKGEAETLTGISIDISEKNQIEETLRYRKALLEAHNEANRDGLLLVDAKGKIISYNQSFIDIWRMPKEIVDAKDDDLALAFAMKQLVNPQQFVDKVKWMYENPSETSFDELEYLDGRIIERHGYSVWGDDGTYYAWSWTFRDITEQKAAAEALKESEAKFRTLSENIPHLVWTATPDGKKNFFNKYFIEYTGFSFEELKGDGWHKIIFPDDLEKELEQWHQHIKTGEDFKIEKRVRHHNGTYRWHISHGIAQKDENGKIIGWIGTNTDITEQKSFREALEENVKVRTLELYEKNLQLEHINAELISFSYISSHDLQEPLRKIQMFSSRILETEADTLSENVINYIERMQRSAHRMQKLIQDLIAYSRVNIQETKFENVDLNIVIEDVKETLIEELEQNNVTFVLNNICDIKIIPVQFTQVILNLLSNSIKYAQEDQPIIIEIDCEKVKGKKTDIQSLSAEQDYIHIRVSDNGIGFEPEYNEKIFEVFQRLHGRDEYTGTGIGLAIVKRIIENHDGVIRANGKLNEGATFDIYIPAP